MATQLFIHKPLGVKVSDEDFAKIWSEVRYKTFCGVRKEPEDPFFIKEYLKFSEQEELEMFFEEGCEAIGLFDINYGANEPPLIEFLEDHFIYCKEITCFATESFSTNILFLLKEKIFAGVDPKVTYDFILNHLHKSKGICFLANEKIEFVNDSNEILKEKGGVYYSTLDFFEEKKVVVTPPPYMQRNTISYQSGNVNDSKNNSGDKTKYNYETKRKLVALLLKQMTGTAMYDQNKTFVYNETKAYLNSMTDDNLDGIMEIYRVKVVN
jgi:hypothetical protein